MAVPRLAIPILSCTVAYLVYVRKSECAALVPGAAGLASGYVPPCHCLHNPQRYIHTCVGACSGRACLRAIHRAYALLGGIAGDLTDLAVHAALVAGTLLITVHAPQRWLSTASWVVGLTAMAAACVVQPVWLPVAAAATTARWLRGPAQVTALLTLAALYAVGLLWRGVRLHATARQECWQDLTASAAMAGWPVDEAMAASCGPAHPAWLDALRYGWQGSRSWVDTAGIQPGMGLWWYALALAPAHAAMYYRAAMAMSAVPFLLLWCWRQRYVPGSPQPHSRSSCCTLLPRPAQNSACSVHGYCRRMGSDHCALASEPH